MKKGERRWKKVEKGELDFPFSTVSTFFHLFPPSFTFFHLCVHRPQKAFHRPPQGSNPPSPPPPATSFVAPLRRSPRKAYKILTRNKELKCKLREQKDSSIYDNSVDQISADPANPSEDGITESKNEAASTTRSRSVINGA